MPYVVTFLLMPWNSVDGVDASFSVELCHSCCCMLFSLTNFHSCLLSLLISCGEVACRSEHWTVNGIVFSKYTNVHYTESHTLQNVSVTRFSDNSWFLISEKLKNIAKNQCVCCTTQNIFIVLPLKCPLLQQGSVCSHFDWCSLICQLHEPYPG